MSPTPAPPGAPARFAFSTARDGDLRDHSKNRQRFAQRVNAPWPWAEVRQVHGTGVVEADGPGLLGEADALFTRRPGLGLAVFVADCVGLVVEADGGVGVAHAGWRGAASGVVAALVEGMRAVGLEPNAAHLGPYIGPCCFEVGPEVGVLFPHSTAHTRAGDLSVDLKQAIASQLPVPIAPGPGCTYHDQSFLSHRRQGPQIGAEQVGRMVALGWLGTR